jgi:ABC-type antimicrobial peptide transport system permease subunit
MLGTHTQKILSDIWTRKTRTLLVAVSIFIGVFGIVTMFTMGDLLVRQLEKDLEKGQLAMVRVSVSPNPNSEANNARLLSLLRSQSEITTAQGQTIYPLTWRKSADENFQSSSLFTYSEPFGAIPLEPMRLESGVFPVPGQNELAVERRFAKKHDLDLGSTLLLRSANGGEETWKIVGTVFFPYSYPGQEIILKEDSLFANYADAQHLLEFKGYSSIQLRYTDFEAAEQSKEELEATISGEGSYIPMLTLTENPDEHSQIRFARMIGNTMTGLAMLALLAAGFLVLNVVSSIVTEQKNQVGILKAMGASRPDILVIYGGIALVYGILGVIPGVLAGIPAGFLAAQSVAETSNSFIDEFAVSPIAVILGIGAGLLIPLLASLFPVFNATRIGIIDAITDLGISSRYGNGILARILGRSPLPITVRQGISNVLRKGGRITLTGIALTVAVGAFMGISALLTGVDAMLDKQFNVTNYHFRVMPSETDDVERLEALIAKQPDEMTVLGPFVELAITIDGFDKVFDPNMGPPALYAIGFDPAYDPYALELESGRSLNEAPDGVLISRNVANYLGKSSGDEIKVHAGGNSQVYPIVGVADFPGDGVWFHWRTLAGLADFTDAGGNPIPTGLLVGLKSDDPTGAEVAEHIEDFNAQLMANEITASFNNTVEFTETITQLFTVFQVIFYFTALLIALVGAIGLLTTLSMGVFERQKEIGVMRSIGANSTTIAAQFITEGLVVGLIAWLIGIPLSYGIYQGMLLVMDVGDEYQGLYSIQVVILGLGSVILLTVLASLSPSLTAARKTVSDILRYQ